VLRISTLSFVRNPQIICANSSTATTTSATLISASMSSGSRGISTAGRVMALLLVASITSHFSIVGIWGRSFIASGFLVLPSFVVPADLLDQQIRELTSVITLMCMIIPKKLLWSSFSLMFVTLLCRCCSIFMLFITGCDRIPMRAQYDRFYIHHWKAKQ
jgi:hypothetical protein